jgi:hypothetical protein
MSVRTMSIIEDIISGFSLCAAVIEVMFNAPYTAPYHARCESQDTFTTS